MSGVIAKCQYSVAMFQDIIFLLHIQIPLPHSDTSPTTFRYLPLPHSIYLPPHSNTCLIFRYLSHFDVIGCILLGSFATLAIFFATTTFYYRKKARALQYGGKVQQSHSFLLISIQCNSMKRGGSEGGRGRGREGNGGEREREGKGKSRRKKELSWKYPQVNKIQGFYTK